MRERVALAPVRRRLHHVLFGVAVGVLALLAVWWFVFLAATVEARDASAREQLALRASLHAERLSRAATETREGFLPGDARFEVVRRSQDPGAAAVAGTELAVRPAPSTLSEQARELHRKRLMIFGEGSLLLVLVAACVAMLHRLVVAERRYRLDVEAFLARVTHEMKTPLAGIKALLQTLKGGRVPAERLDELVAMGLRQAEREEHLIENLLAAHRLVVGTPSPRAAALDVRRVLTEFVAHRHASMGAGAEEHALACPEGLEALGHAGSVRTILENLCDNAFKYGARSVSLEARPRPGGAIEIDIRDDGDGFTAREAASLFAPFLRGDNARVRATHGTGLGLSLARSLAQEMGGDLRGSSPGPGQGACFTLTLPPPPTASAAHRRAEATP